MSGSAPTSTARSPGVVFVHQSSEVGGAELMLEALARQLERSGVMRAAHFCPLPGALPERLRSANECPVWMYERFHRGRHVAEVVRAARTLRRLAREFDADLLVGSSTRGYLYASIAGLGTATRTAAIFHDPIRVKSVFERVVSSVRPPATTLFSSRRPLAESPRHIRSRPGAAIVQAAVDAERIDGCVGDTGRADATEDAVFVCIARLQEHKGHDVLLEAFHRVLARHPTARLVCVGEVSPVARPGFEARLHERIRRDGLADRVALTGFLPDCQVFDEVRRARALVHAAWHESFGLSLLEAMYLGTPVVTTAAEGPRRIVEDGVTGFVVPVGDAEALSSRMLDLSGNADLARRLGDAARRTVARRFPPQDTFDDFVRACRRIGLMP